MESDFAAAKAESSKIAQDPLKYKTITVPQGDASSVSSTADETTVAQEEKKTRTLKVTTTEDRNTTTQVQTTVETTGGGFTTRTRPKTEKTVLSENGFTSRQSQITEYFVIGTERENLKKFLSAKVLNRHKDIDSFSKIKLKQKPLIIREIIGRQYKNDGSKIILYYDLDIGLPAARNLKAVVFGDTNEIAVTLGDGIFAKEHSVSDLQVVKIKYSYLENIDPNFKG
tara:strand:- start:81 stop:761 length:681 start_codon:yes stop_codon:yes gene_type:complete